MLQQICIKKFVNLNVLLSVHLLDFIVLMFLPRCRYAIPNQHFVAFSQTIPFPNLQATLTWQEPWHFVSLVLIKLSYFGFINKKNFAKALWKGNTWESILNHTSKDISSCIIFYETSGEVAKHLGFDEKSMVLEIVKLYALILSKNLHLCKVCDSAMTFLGLLWL